MTRAAVVRGQRGVPNQLEEGVAQHQFAAFEALVDIIVEVHSDVRIHWLVPTVAVRIVGIKLSGRLAVVNVLLWEASFRSWYPGFRPTIVANSTLAAA